jgi:hypothetical protein
VFAAVVATATHVVAVAAEETRSTTKKRAAERDALPARPDDVYLLTHFARHVGAFRANDETFAPVCLPRRDPNTFAHAHVSFLSTREPTENENETETENDARGTFLVLVADEGGPDAFHAVRRCKEDVEKALRFKHAGSVGGGGSGSLSLLDAIERRVASPPRGIEPPSPANPRPGALARGSVRLADEVPRAAGGGGENRRVLHFLYVRPPLGQYVAPEWAAPLDGRDAQKKTLRAYRRVADAVSASAATSDEENEDSDSEPREVRHRRVPSRDGSQTSERGGGGGGGVHAGLTSFFQGLGLGGGVSARSGSGSGSPSGGARAPRAGGRKVTKAKGDVGERRKVHFESCAARVLLGFAGGDFELYVAMAPGTSRADAVAACNRLCTWLRQEEPRLFAAAA